MRERVEIATLEIVTLVVAAVGLGAFLLFIVPLWSLKTNVEAMNRLLRDEALRRRQGQ